MNFAATVVVGALLGAGVVSVGSAAEESGPERSNSRPGGDSDRPCRQAIEQSALLNGEQLFEAADACARAGVVDDAVFLLLAGQARALTDISLLKPVSEAEQGADTKLYGALYYKYGGSGSAELFRDAFRAAAMVERLRTWRPAFPEGYSPGWRYHGPVDSERYQATVNRSIESRLAKLESYRRSLADDR